MSSLKDLNVARKTLVASLGDRAKLYFEKMKLWFQMKKTKEEFDYEVRSIMSDNQVRLHNEFLLCLFNKVRGLVASDPQQRSKRNINLINTQSVKEQNRNLKRKYRTDNCNFEGADVYAEVSSRVSSPVGDEPTGANRSIVQELILPDHTVVLARLLLTAWENNMDGAEDTTAYLIIAATHIFLKNILMVLLTRRKGYAIHDELFIHNIGGTIPSIGIRNITCIVEEYRYKNTTNVVNPNGQVPSTKISIEDAEQDAAYTLGCSTQTLSSVPPPISIGELLKTLRIHKNLINNHVVCTTNYERLFTCNTHLTKEDLKADKVLL